MLKVLEKKTDLDIKPSLVLDVTCFNLRDTLECGQCFRWNRLDYNEDRNISEYIGVIQDRVIRIKQDYDKLYIYSNVLDDLEETVNYYFDLYNNYDLIETAISCLDVNVEKALESTSGIHILNQANIETLLSFIISSNNNIPRIRKSIDMICKRYGTRVMFEGKDYYLFPTLEELKDVTISDFRECGVGFRDRYLYKTVQDLIENNIYTKFNSKLSNSQLKTVLMSFLGVGSKVADCVMLFSFGRQDVFPIDVWVKRVMEKLYFGRECSIKEIANFAERNFGDFAGIVQQHLFYNMRNNMI